jgi:hypothetical protein
MSLPRVEIAGARWPRRATRWVVAQLETPGPLARASGFTAAIYWSMSGALGAGLATSLYVMLVSGTLWTADFTLTLGWATFAALGVLVLVWPFLLSYYMFLPMYRTPAVPDRASRGGVAGRPAGAVASRTTGAGVAGRTADAVASRTAGAVYGAAWHLIAHLLFMSALDASPRASFLAIPVGVGALWGSWLPATAADPRRL